MSIAFLGDIHGWFRRLHHVLEELPEDVPLIQVGDFGCWPQFRDQWKAPKRPIYFIDGNHDHHPTFSKLTVPTEVWPGATYVPRGTILELAGKRVGFLGGAHSVDYKSRTPQVDWFPELEVVTADQTSMLAGRNVDILVTHTAPHFIIKKHLDPFFLKRFFDLPLSYVDHSTVVIEELWENLGKPQLVCGHLHRRITDGTVRVLDINELWVMK
jgi:predicted phosphodiesterase